MLTTNVSLSTEKELTALSRVLREYIDKRSKVSVAEILARKANDVRIQLFRGYWAQRWKGSRRGALQSEGVAFRQMRQRARAGQGIRLRQLLTQQGPSPQAPVQYFQRRRLRALQGPLKRKTGHNALRRVLMPITMSTYQRRVWTELSRRQRGIGVLGVAFLLQRYRKRFSTTQGAYVRTGSSRFRDNRTALPQLDVQEMRGFNNAALGRLTLAPTFARIEGFVPGQAEVGERNSILAIALADVRTDIEKYLYRDTIDSIATDLEAAGLPIS